MGVVNDVGELASALGGLGGVGTLITALSGLSGRTKVRVAASAADPDIPLDSAPGSIQERSSTPRAVYWSVVSGAVAMLLALAVVILIGATTLGLDQLPLELVEWGVVACAVLTMLIVLPLLRRAIQSRQTALTCYAVAGLVAVFGALAAIAIAGST